MIEAVWWVNEETYERIITLDLWEAGAPLYVAAQYRSAKGRPGRGRLWVDKQFGEVSMKWKSDHPNAVACEDRAGIVMTWEAAVAVLAACKAERYTPLITDGDLVIWHQVAMTYGAARDSVTEDDVREFRTGFVSAGAVGPIYNESVAFGLACVFKARAEREFAEKERKKPPTRG